MFESMRDESNRRSHQRERIFQAPPEPITENESSDYNTCNEYSQGQSQSLNLKLTSKNSLNSASNILQKSNQIKILHHVTNLEHAQKVFSSSLDNAADKQYLQLPSRKNFESQTRYVIQQTKFPKTAEPRERLTEEEIIKEFQSETSNGQTNVMGVENSPHQSLQYETSETETYSESSIAENESLPQHQKVQTTKKVIYKVFKDGEIVRKQVIDGAHSNFEKFSQENGLLRLKLNDSFGDEDIKARMQRFGKDENFNFTRTHQNGNQKTVTTVSRTVTKHGPELERKWSFFAEHAHNVQNVDQQPSGTESSSEIDDEF